MRYRVPSTEAANTVYRLRYRVPLTEAANTPLIRSIVLDVETSDGVVRSSHPLLRELADPDRRDGEDRDERRDHRRTLRTRMGDGGKTRRVRTEDGTIRIEH